MKKILFLLIINFTLSCRQDKHAPVIQLVADTSFSVYPDSSFFSDIRVMQFQNNDLYLGDYSRKDIAVIDVNFSRMHTIGAPGPGPREIGILSRFYVCNDTMYVYDYMAAGIKIFNSAGYLGSFTLPTERRIPEGYHFFVRENTYYLPYETDTSNMLMLKKNGVSTPFGTLHDFGNNVQNRIRNDRSLFYVGQRLYAVSDNLPYIQVYNTETLKQTSTFDFSDNNLTKKALQFVNSKQTTPNSYYTIIEYAYLFQNYLYLLCSTWERGLQCNHLLEITLEPSMEVTGIYQLPGDFYKSFCISPSYLFAFNEQNSTIERFKFDKK